MTVSTFCTHRAILVAALSLVGMATLLLPRALFAQEQSAYFELRPHCSGELLKEGFGGPLPNVDQLINPGTGRCSSYPVRDPEYRETPILAEGETLDLDLVLHNPTRMPLTNAVAYILYDPVLLTGIDLQEGDEFTVPAPGEYDFFPNEGLIRIVLASSSTVTNDLITVARIRLSRNSSDATSTALVFDMDNTAALRNDNVDILTSIQSSLFVRLSDETEFIPQTTSSSSSSQSSSSSSSSSSREEEVVPEVVTEAESSSSSTSSQASSLPVLPEFSLPDGPLFPAAPSLPELPDITQPFGSLFATLQVQALRVTTRGTDIFVAWNALLSPDIFGYELFYGTVPGNYIHKRTLSAEDVSDTIEDLPTGRTYYIAVRGVNTEGVKSDFSQEVAVTVGDPSTATAQLVANRTATHTPRNDGSIAGDTGSASLLTVFLLISASIGMLFAFRRQLLAR